MNMCSKFQISSCNSFLNRDYIIFWYIVSSLRFVSLRSHLTFELDLQKVGIKVCAKFQISRFSTFCTLFDTNFYDRYTHGHTDVYGVYNKGLARPVHIMHGICIFVCFYSRMMHIKIKFYPCTDDVSHTAVSCIPKLSLFHNPIIVIFNNNGLNEIIVLHKASSLRFAPNPSSEIYQEQQTQSYIPNYNSLTKVASSI